MSQVTVHKLLEIQIMCWSEGTCNSITNYTTLASDSHLLHGKLSLNTGYSECSSNKTNSQLIAAFLSHSQQDD